MNGGLDEGQLDPLILALRNTAATIDCLMARRLRGLSISFQHVRALQLVGSGRAETASGLCTTMSMTAGPVTRMLDLIEGRSWVVRGRVATDRRVLRLELTEAGRKILAQALPLVARASRDVIDAIQAGDRAVVERVLTTMDNTARNARMKS